jgi:RNA polymerase sigma-70 factor, ECF subfamily
VTLLPPLTAKTVMRVLTPEQQCTLAERVRAREPSAEEELVRLFASRIGVMARTRLRDAEAARDVTQDVLLAVVRALRNGHLRDPERLTAFVYGIARNRINDHLRARVRLPPQDPIDDHVLIGTDPDLLDRRERSDLVRRALAELSPTDRTILLLTLSRSLKPGEIAVRLGLTSEVVRARKSRALRKIAEWIGKLSRT